MATKTAVKETFGTDNFTMRGKDCLYYDKYTACLTMEDKGSLAAKAKAMLTRKTDYTEKIHEELTALFVPSEEWLEQMAQIELTEEQKKYAACSPGKRTKLLGAPGSGKTIVIAQKAINCYREKQQPVLILTYNITLKNYIRDKIAANSRELSVRERSMAFEILHFDQFLPQMLRKYGLKGPDISRYTSKNGKIDWERYQKKQMGILSAAHNMIESYMTVLIDEAQDFSDLWFEFIEKNYVADQADYLVVADEKQNIYGRKMDEWKLPRVSGIRGQWSKLKGSHRMTAGGYQLAVSFQQQFMRGKYNLDEPVQLDLFSIMEKRAYYRIEKFDPKIIYSMIQSFRKDNSPISPNDICILTCSIRDAQQIDYCFRTQLGEKSTQTVCETLEMNKKLREKSGVDNDNISFSEKEKRKADLVKDLNEIRHARRNAFNMNPGTIKISTIHSFKGWEINTVVLVINEISPDMKITPELVYTAITRTKGNLLIINCGNNFYHSFFAENLMLRENEYHTDTI